MGRKGIRDIGVDCPDDMDKDTENIVVDATVAVVKALTALGYVVTVGPVKAISAVLNGVKKNGE